MLSILIAFHQECAARQQLALAKESEAAAHRRAVELFSDFSPRNWERADIGNH